MTYRPGGAHPTGYLRVLILAEMLRRMDFTVDAQNLVNVWKRLYDPRRGHRIPGALLRDATRAIPALVDEIAFQPRRALAERTLASVIPFRREDQAAIRRGGVLLAHAPAFAEDLPPRFLVSAACYAIEAGASSRNLNKLLAQPPRAASHRGRQCHQAQGRMRSNMADPAFTTGPVEMRDRTPIAIRTDNLIRQRLRIGDPRDPDEVAEGLKRLLPEGRADFSRPNRWAGPWRRSPTARRSRAFRNRWRPAPR